jgi:hypothetical protein
MGSGFKNFTAASVLTASDVNNYLMEQSVMSFASTGARDTQITSPEDGMVAYVGSNDANEGLYTYNGTSWRKGPGWNAPWGRVGSFTGNTNIVTTTTGDTAISCTASIVANRNYRFTFSSRIINTVALNNQYAFYLRRDGANVVYFDSPIISASDYHPLTYVGFFTSTTTTSSTFLINLAFLAQPGINFSGSIGPNFLTIEDIGPSGAPT